MLKMMVYKVTTEL